MLALRKHLEWCVINIQLHDINDLINLVEQSINAQLQNYIFKKLEKGKRGKARGLIDFMYLY